MGSVSDHCFFLLGAPVAQWFKHRPTDLTVPGSILAFIIIRLSS